MICALSLGLINNASATATDNGKISQKVRDVVKLESNNHGNKAKATGRKQANKFKSASRVGKGEFYTGNETEYWGQIYFVLKKMMTQGRMIPQKDLLEITKRMLAWANDKGPKQDLTKELEKFRKSYGSDLKDLAGFLGKILIEADYPMWIDKSGRVLSRNEIRPSDKNLTNLDLGNAAKGINGLLFWQNRMIQNPESRTYLQNMIKESASILDPSKKAGHAEILKTLLINLEDIGTLEGETYVQNKTLYGTDNDEIYSNSELSVVLREILPVTVQILARTDRPVSLTGFDETSREKGVYILRECMNNLKSIGFNPDTLSIERSLMDLIAHDQWGRKRTKDGWAGSFLESAVFLCAASANTGWLDGGEIPGKEVTKGLDDPRRKHGPGTYTGYMTLNDGLNCGKFNMMTVPVLGTKLGIYELAFKDNDGENVFRSMKSFKADERDRYRFYYNQNYPITNIMAGATSGDSGVSSGGNPNGYTADELSRPQSLMNNYSAYSGDGRYTKDLGAWTINWAVRACFDGEGPYYYKAPGAATVMINGKKYHRYLRPNGKTYALVNHSTLDHIYPAEDGDPIDYSLPAFRENNKERYQRYNRYKAVWNSDYFMVQRKDYFAGLVPRGKNKKKLLTLDNSTHDIKFIEVDDSQSASALKYYETVDEDDKARGCKTPEEAFFRNYQWVENEKKIVILLPLFMDLNRSLAALKMDFLEPYTDLGQGVTFVAFEANGWSGASNLKKFSGNHVWNKKGSSGRSNIPGDSRCELVLNVGGAGSILANEERILNEVIGSGGFIPGVTSHNLPSLFRLAFPLSPEITRNAKLDIHDTILGSKDFKVGDAVWKKRNAVVPLFIALCAAVDSKTTGYDPEKKHLHDGLQTMITGSITLIKPMMYYQKDKGSYLRDSWKARVVGKNCGDYTGDPALMSTADYYESHDDVPLWYGSWGEREHYQALPMKTLMNILVDSDNRIPEKRMDGILPVILEKKILSNLFKLLLSKPNDSDHLYASLEQIMTSVKFTKAQGTRINENNSKKIVYPGWMFASEASSTSAAGIKRFRNTRPEDILLDKGMDKVIGQRSGPDRKGYGLVHYLDMQKKENWAGYYGVMDTLEDFLHPQSKYNLLVPSLNITNSLLTGAHPLSDEEIKALVYYTGTFLKLVEEGK
jgi:hypothetical protein